MLDLLAASDGCLIIGIKGTGKSTLLLSIAQELAEDGQGAILIDPHGDLSRQVAAYLPAHRLKDVVYLDAGDEEAAWGANLFEPGQPVTRLR